MSMLDTIRAKHDQIYAIAREHKAEKLWVFGSGLINKRSQEGRASAMKRYVESALGNPQIVGVHWHQYSDQATSGRFDGEHFQVGWTDICDRPYPETIRALRSINIYGTRFR